MGNNQYLVSPCLPQAAWGDGPFTVVESPNEYCGACAPPRRGEPGIFQVPSSDKPHSVAVRLHEMGHLILERAVPWFSNVLIATDSNPEGWPPAMLDVIVNDMMLNLGNTAITKLETRAVKMVDDSYSRSVEATLYLREQLLDGDYHYGKLTREDKKYLDTVHEKLCSIASTEGPRGLREFKDIFNQLNTRYRLEEKDRHMVKLLLGLVPGGGGDDALFSKEEDVDFLTDMLFDISSRRATAVSAPLRGIFNLTDSYYAPVRNKGTRFTHGTSGPMRYPHRMPPIGDGLVFARRRVAKGGRGAVLIDCSGSMRLTADDISSVLDMRPDAIVTLYGGTSGRRGLGGGGQFGDIVIVAKDRRIVSAEKVKTIMSRFDGTNAIDEHALQWLSKQSKPRIWVSDGQVTGKSDDVSPTIRRVCQFYLERGEIIQVSKPSKLCEALAKLKHIVEKGRNADRYEKVIGELPVGVDPEADVV